MNKFVSRFLYRPLKSIPEKRLLVLLAVVTGLASGLAASIFERLIHLIKHGLTSWVEAQAVNYLYLLLPAVGILLVVLFLRFAIKDDISEGVTKVLVAISKKGSKIKPHNCYSSVVSAATTIGFGGSVGPEAPAMMTGSAIGSNIARFMKLNYKETTLLLGCGAAAAISAMFKAPLTGVVFVLEVVMLDISVSLIVPLLLSAVSATSLVYFLTGFTPLFSVDVEGLFELRHLPFYGLLAIICGLTGFYFTSVASKIGGRFEKIKSVYRRWIVGSVMLGVMIFLFPPLYGDGYGSLQALMAGDHAHIFDNSLLYGLRDNLLVIVLFFIAIPLFKVVAMATTNGAGGVGGSFAPSLFVGAFLGFTFALVANRYFGLTLPAAVFVLVGMSGVMSGVMNAPLTSIFLIAELTGGYSLFVPLMLVATVSYLICYYLEPYSIYTKKLAAKGELMTHNKDNTVLLFLNLRKLIETDLAKVHRDMTLGQLVNVVSVSRRNIFPVVDFDGKLEGIVTLDDIRKDMFSAALYKENHVSDYMNPVPDAIVVNESMNSVLDKFEATRTWNLPVVDEKGKYLGFVSKSKIFSAYRDQLMEISADY